MPPEHKPFHCELVTPHGTTADAEALSVTFPAADGMVGVMANRAPGVVQLGAGPLIVTGPDGEQTLYHVSGGTARFDERGLMVLAEEASLAADLDPERIWEEIQAARRMPRDTHEESVRRQEALSSARLKFRLAQQAREGGAWGPE